MYIGDRHGSAKQDPGLRAPGCGPAPSGAREPPGLLEFVTCACAYIYIYISIYIYIYININSTILYVQINSSRPGPACDQALHVAVRAGAGHINNITTNSPF